MTCRLNKWVMAAAIAVTSAAQATTVVVPVGDQIRLRDDALGGASTIVSLDSVKSTMYFSNGTADPAAPPPARLISVGGLVGALNVGRTVVTGEAGVEITQGDVPVGKLQRPNRGIVNIGVPVASLATDSGTGVFSIVNTTGGFNLTSPYINGVMDGGTVTVKNLRVDLINKQVLADLVGRPLISQDDPTLVYGDEVVFSGALWDIGAIAGPTSLPPVDLLAAIGGDASALAARGYVLSGSRDLVLNGRTNKVYDVTATTLLSKLTVTEQGFEAFAHALGDVVGTTGYVTLVNVNNGAAGWGTLKLDMKASFMEEPQLSYPPITEVPEPETHVLMGIGLLGLAGAVRRRRGA